MNDIASMIINELFKKGMISGNEIEICKYYLVCVFESGIVFISILIMGAVFQEFINICVFIVSFINIRNRTGGFHFNSFWKCFVGSLLLSSVPVLAIRFITVKILHIIDVLVILSFGIMLSVGTLNHSNMNYSKEEYAAIKKDSRIFLLLICSCILFLRICHALYKMIFFMQYAVILSAVLLMLGQIKSNCKKMLCI